MTSYELMIKTNHYLIKGNVLTEKHRSNIVSQLLSARSSSDQAKRFYTGLKYPNNTDKAGRGMYPIFFIPPYSDGKKLKTILYQTPKTHILSANMYELEILRLLYLLDPENEQINYMVNETIKRLKTTCFGYMDDGVGECFDTSLVVLRFLATVAPHDTEWIKSRIDNYNRHSGDKTRSWFSSWYYWLCLSELPFEAALPEIEKDKTQMLDVLTNKSFVMNSEQDKSIHPVLLCILRNIISKYPEYEYIKDRQPHESEKDGRLHFNMNIV